jgi:hypothetical protein
LVGRSVVVAAVVAVVDTVVFEVRIVVVVVVLAAVEFVVVVVDNEAGIAVDMEPLDLKQKEKDWDMSVWFEFGTFVFVLGWDHTAIVLAPDRDHLRVVDVRARTTAQGSPRIGPRSMKKNALAWHRRDT